MTKRSTLCSSPRYVLVHALFKSTLIQVHACCADWAISSLKKFRAKGPRPLVLLPRLLSFHDCSPFSLVFRFSFSFSFLFRFVFVSFSLPEGPHRIFKAIRRRFQAHPRSPKVFIEKRVKEFGVRVRTYVTCVHVPQIL